MTLTQLTVHLEECQPCKLLGAVGRRFNARSASNDESATIIGGRFMSPTGLELRRLNLSDPGISLPYRCSVRCEPASALAQSLDRACIFGKDERR